MYNNIFLVCKWEKRKRQIFFSPVLLYTLLHTTTFGGISIHVRTVFVPQSSFYVFYKLQTKGFKIMRQTLDWM